MPWRITNLTQLQTLQTFCKIYSYDIGKIAMGITNHFLKIRFTTYSEIELTPKTDMLQRKWCEGPETTGL